MFGKPSHSYKNLDFLDYAFHVDQVVNNKVTPQSYKQAAHSNKKKEWKQACKREYNVYIENKTWKLMPPLKFSKDGKKHIIM